MYAIDEDELYPYRTFELVTDERPVRFGEDVREIPTELVDALDAARAAETLALARITLHLEDTGQLPL